MASLIVCPSCHLHARARERECPHCGAALRDANGRVAPTSVALLMGLTLVGCGDDVSALYGVESTAGTQTSAGPTTALYGNPATVSATGSSSTGSTGVDTSGTETTGATGTTGETETETDSETETTGDTETTGGTETGGETSGTTSLPTSGGQPLYGAADT
ncbi:MAG: hypothetical protein H6713_30575 [Myxococcales bacterium]|nr:hypothetical protein [Myxococcales bacterium]MCB9754309.1 hypothetical protein [Myxococcales bacterium]